MRALVTGGEAGIGRALVDLLRAEDADVLVLDLASGDDVADPHVWERVPSVELAFLNAGVQTAQRDITAVTEDAYRRVLATNVDGLFLGVRHLAGVMPVGGSIVVTGSDAGLSPTPRDPVYGMSKHAAVGFVRSVAPFLIERQIRINIVCPGAVDTEMVPQDVRERLRGAGELLAPAVVAAAALAVARSDGTGIAWLVGGDGVPRAFRFADVD